MWLLVMRLGAFCFIGKGVVGVGYGAVGIAVDCGVVGVGVVVGVD